MAAQGRPYGQEQRRSQLLAWAAAAATQLQKGPWALLQRPPSSSGTPRAVRTEHPTHRQERGLLSIDILAATGHPSDQCAHMKRRRFVTKECRPGLWGRNRIMSPWKALRQIRFEGKHTSHITGTVQRTTVLESSEMRVAQLA